MGLFGRRRSRQDQGQDQSVDRADEATGSDGGFDGPDPDDWPEGPYDEADAPDDGLGRLDLGSIRIPLPEGAQLQVEMDPAGPVRAVHLITPLGQITINGYAAPRSGGLWEDVCGELAEQLRADGARVHSAVGDWGQELVASLGDVSLRFVGVDGPRWMVRGVVAGPPENTEQGCELLRELLRGTIVVRGTQAMPVRAPLTIDLPPAIAEHIATQTGPQL